MESLLINLLKELLGQSVIILLIILILGYFVKMYLEKRVQWLATKIEEVGKTSLQVKKELRSEERSQLLAFRVAVETWEDHLLFFLEKYINLKPGSAEETSNTLFEKDRELFFNVKIAIVKLSIYLRDEHLEKQLMDAVIKIRQSYYPIIYDVLPRIIDIQTQLIPIQLKLDRFFQSNFQDVSAGPTESDRQTHLMLQTQLTEETKNFANELLKCYPMIAEQMVDLKTSMNDYIYRPMKDTDISKE